jgi:hypothetical protein
MKETSCILSRIRFGSILVASGLILLCSHSLLHAQTEISSPPRDFAGKWSGLATYSSFGRVFGSYENFQCDEQKLGRSRPTLTLNIQQNQKVLKLEGSVVCHKKGKLLLQDSFPETEFEISSGDLLLNGEKVGLLTNRVLSILAAGRKISGMLDESGSVKFSYEIYGNPGKAQFSGAFTHNPSVVRYP